jgi:hypothetical protein
MQHTGIPDSSEQREFLTSQSTVGKPDLHRSDCGEDKMKMNASHIAEDI